MVDESLPHGDLPVSRSAALASGSRRYFTGKPCRNGHLGYRLAATGTCSECVRMRRNPDVAYERVKAWRRQHPEARTEEARRYRAKYPEKVLAKVKRYQARHRERLLPLAAANARARRRADPEGEKRRRMAFRERHEHTLAEIAGRPRPNICDLCYENHGGIVFDHCHEHGHFRGWLCDRCNKVLGLIKDSPQLLDNMARYLERSNGEIDGKTEERATGE